MKAYSMTCFSCKSAVWDAGTRGWVVKCHLKVCRWQPFFLFLFFLVDAILKLVWKEMTLCNRDPIDFFFEIFSSFDNRNRLTEAPKREGGIYLLKRQFVCALTFLPVTTSFKKIDGFHIFFKNFSAFCIMNKKYRGDPRKLS